MPSSPKESRLLVDHRGTNRRRGRHGLTYCRSRRRRSGWSRCRSCRAGSRCRCRSRCRARRCRTHPLLGDRGHDTAGKPLCKHRPPRPIGPHIGQTIVATKRMGPGLGQPPGPANAGGTLHDAIAPVSGNDTGAVAAGRNRHGHGQHQNDFLCRTHPNLLVMGFLPEIDIFPASMQIHACYCPDRLNLPFSNRTTRTCRGKT